MPAICYVGNETYGLCMLGEVLYWLRDVPSLEALLVCEIISTGLPSIQLSFIYKYLLNIYFAPGSCECYWEWNQWYRGVCEQSWNRACKYPKARVVASATPELLHTPSWASLSCVGPHILSTSGGDFSHKASFMSLSWQPYCHGLEHSTLICKAFPSHYSLH